MSKKEKKHDVIHDGDNLGDIYFEVRGGINDILNEQELKNTRDDRSDILIANFIDGYASGWRFAVPECFKPSLDIKLTSRVIKEKTYFSWTQGNNFSFNTGDVFYSDRIAYKDYSSALIQDDFLCVQVTSEAAGNGDRFKLDETYSIRPHDADTNLFCLHTKGGKIIRHPIGSLTVSRVKLDKSRMEFSVLKPNREKTALTEIKRFECRPDRFVAMLQSGILFAHQSPPVNVFSVGVED